MRIPLRNFLRQPFYPWLLGIAPILHLYAANLGLVVDSEVALSILIMLAGTALAFYQFKRGDRSAHLAAVMTSLCLLAFSLSGHIYILIFMPISLGIWTLIVLAGLAVILLALRKTGSRKFLAQATPSFNLIALALLAPQLISVAAGLLELSKYAHIYAESIADATPRQSAPKAMDSPAKPDIYYIVPDGYPSDAWLKATENYDNSPFTKALEERGFVVVGHAQSNYGITLMSMSSVLNMKYYPANPTPYSDFDFLRLEGANSEVARRLAELGYTTIQLLSGSYIPSLEADIVRDFTPRGRVDIEVDIKTISEGMSAGTLANLAELARIERSYKRSFFDAYMDTTLLRLARSRIGKLFPNAGRLPYHTSAPERFLDTIDEVVKISAMPEATFTIMPLVKPHIPVVFNERGEQIPWIRQPSPEEFFAELSFVNSEFLRMIDSILANSKHPPVIIFQADHGSIRGMGPAASESGRNTLFDIYAAYHLPSKDSVDFPQPFTAVNTFRLIFNAVFDAGLELLDDKLFELPGKYKAPFKQVDVTEEFLHYP